MNKLFRDLTLNQTYRTSLTATKARQEKEFTRTLLRTISFMERNKISVPEMEYHAKTNF